MPRGNPQYLVTTAMLTEEERKDMATRAGKASGEARRKKSVMREIARAMLDSELLDTDAIAAELKSKGLDATGAGAILLAQLQKAYNGDTKAAKFVRDTSGQKPVGNTAIKSIFDKPLEALDLNELTDEQLHSLIFNMQKL